MKEDATIAGTDVLIVVDVQNDFLSGRRARGAARQ